MLSDKLLEEWNFQKNTFAPDTIKSKSGLKVWWLGKCGHEWQAVVYSRTAGRGCPICAGKQVLVGFNDFASNFPYLICFWSANNILSPEHYTSSSGKKVLWVCDKNHEWEATIDNRVKGKGCPVCAGKRVLVGFNDLATLNPELVPQWSSKNSVQPYEVTVKSNRKILWVCNKNHEWETSVANRTKGTGCPYCAGSLCVEGYNDLSTLYPDVVSEWHPTKNIVNPNEITSHSKLKVWWLCNKGHEWEASVGNRTRAKSGCPYCSGRLPTLGLTDLATTHPNLAEEFHKEKNPLGLLEKVSHGSDVKVWWSCDMGHEWQAMVYSRTNSKPTGCPDCSALQTSSKAEQSLQNFVKSIHSFSVVFNARSIIYPYELDVYVPDKKIAFEFNGVYWHNEHHKDRNYHYDKWRACKDKGIQLIQIWEDDWETKPDIVKDMILYKLGVTEARKMYARKTFVKALSREETNSFLSSNHIQGAVDGGIRVGLFENTINKTLVDTKPKLIAVMVLKREPGKENVLNLLRFATSANVVGGFTKLLKYIEKEFTPRSIVTFSDNTVSDGGLYENNGFVSVKDIKPDYMYVVNKRREHKFSYRLKRFENDPNLIFDVKLSERQLALLNNIPRIWDAGKIKWELFFKD